MTKKAQPETITSLIDLRRALVISGEKALAHIMNAENDHLAKIEREIAAENQEVA